MGCNPLEKKLFIKFPGDCQPTNNMTFSCSQTKLIDHPVSSGVTCDQHVESVISRLTRDYRTKSVGTQIFHNAGFAPIPYTGRKFRSH